MITSMSNPRVKQVLQWQTKAKDRRRDKVFIVEGRKMFEEAPEELIKEVYVSESFLRMSGVESGQKSIHYEEVSDAIFHRMSDTQTPQGILAVLKQPEYDLHKFLEDVRSGQQAAPHKDAGSVKKQSGLFLILENLLDPGNLGTIMRTAEGAGVTAVIMSSQTVDIFNPKVIRATMGSIYRVPFLYVENLTDTLQLLHEYGVKSYAAHLQGANYYDSFDFREPTAFLIGNEGNGLTKELADAATAYLKIPMEGKLESLNASVAAALLMYEAHRQRV